MIKRESPMSYENGYEDGYAKKEAEVTAEITALRLRAETAEKLLGIPASAAEELGTQMAYIASLIVRAEAAEKERDELRRGMEVLMHKPLDVIESEAYAKGQRDFQGRAVEAMYAAYNCKGTSNWLAAKLLALPIKERP